MEKLVIDVRAAPGGWAVWSSVLAAPLVFLSGGKAERQAHCLGKAIALAGRWVEIAVYDRQHCLIAALQLEPAAPRGGVASRAPSPSNDDRGATPRPSVDAPRAGRGLSLQLA
ncbi:MAG: hypothetical protein JWQ52_486 [Phenylobacterium sp.]|jgi:hypothetical protein|nr:hypothetical protein [Phenylobacterium sp.]